MASTHTLELDVDLERAAEAAYTAFTAFHQDARPYADLSEHSKQTWRRVARSIVPAVRVKDGR